MYLSKIVENFLTFESFVLFFYGISLGDLYIVIGKHKKIWFATKSNKYDWPNKISINVLIKFCYSWMGVMTKLFLDFCFFTIIIDKFLYIVDKFDVVVNKIFFQCNEV